MTYGTNLFHTLLISIHGMICLNRQRMIIFLLNFVCNSFVPNNHINICFTGYF